MSSNRTTKKARSTRVKKVETKVLEIHQLTKPKKQSTVAVSLTKGNLIGNVNNDDIFLGLMTYNNGKKIIQVDLVEAVFSSGNAGQPGNVSLEIYLTQGNKFDTSTDPVTTIPTPDTPGTIPKHCIDIGAVSKDRTMVTITFQGPREGEFVGYPALYFHTVEGIIDPGLVIKRLPR